MSEVQTADKRSVHTDALATLGTIIGDGEARDAIHLGVEPIIAGEKLYPGAHITIRDDRAFQVEDGALGIVDPFLMRPVEAGQRFWLVVMPRKITSLRHVWEHPEFKASGEINPMHAKAMKSQVEESKRWIDAYAESLSDDDRDYESCSRTITGDELINAASNYVNHDDYLSRGGLLEGVGTDPEFWTHYEIVTGSVVGSKKGENFFSCSC